jgi:hypothetical protein
MSAGNIVVRVLGRLGALSLAAHVICISVASGQAPVPPMIVDASGFESPKFDITFGPGGPGTGSGQLEGQTPSTFQGTWLRTKGIGLSTADVQTAVKLTGNQALEVTRVANSDDRWAVPVGGYPSLAEPRFICIAWDMRVEQTIGPANTFGPFFGVEAYDDDAAVLGLLGTLGVDASNGEVLIQQAGTGFLAAPGPTVTFGAWNNFMIELDFLNHTYEYFLNNVSLGVEGFVDQGNVPGGLNEFTDADIATFAAAGDPASQALAGTAYFDNFKVMEGPCVIPEPTSCVMVGLAGMGLVSVARSRRRAVIVG